MTLRGRAAIGGTEAQDAIIEPRSSAERRCARHPNETMNAACAHKNAKIASPDAGCFGLVRLNSLRGSLNFPLNLNVAKNVATTDHADESSLVDDRELIEIVRA